MAELLTIVDLFPGSTIGVNSITIQWDSFDTGINLTPTSAAKADVFVAALIKQLSRVYADSVRTNNPEVSHRVTLPVAPSTEQVFISNGVTEVYDRYDISVQSYKQRANIPAYTPTDFAP